MSAQKAGFVPPNVALTATHITRTTTTQVNIINPEINGVPAVSAIVYNTNTFAAGTNQVTLGYYFCGGSNWKIFKTNKNVDSTIGVLSPSYTLASNQAS